MPLTSRLFGPRLARAFLMMTLSGVAVSACARTATPNLDFDKTFHADGESDQLHYHARYLLNGQSHQLESWRDRALRLKRRTDDSIETILYRPANQAEWHMVVLDLKRRIRTDIDRTNLARIGHFTDWFAQSHSLNHPIGTYQLGKLAQPPVDQKPAAPCQWYRLKQGAFENNICWSAKLHLPMTIANKAGQVQWRVTAFDTEPFSQQVFHIDDQGFAKNDANDDIKPD